MTDPETIALTLRPEHDDDDQRGRGPAIRLRQFLKAMLRRGGWRCVRIDGGEQPEVAGRRE